MSQRVERATGRSNGFYVTVGSGDGGGGGSGSGGVFELIHAAQVNWVPN